MAIVPTPSRHLAALVTPQFKHLGGIGESILSKRPNWRLRKMVYGGQAGSLGQIADYGSDTDLWGPGGADYNAGTTYTPSTGASQNLTLNDIELILSGKKHLHGNPIRKPKKVMAELAGLS